MQQYKKMRGRAGVGDFTNRRSKMGKTITSVNSRNNESNRLPAEAKREVDCIGIFERWLEHSDELLNTRISMSRRFCQLKAMNKCCSYQVWKKNKKNGPLPRSSF